MQMWKGTRHAGATRPLRAARGREHSRAAEACEQAEARVKPGLSAHVDRLQLVKFLNRIGKLRNNISSFAIFCYPTSRQYRSRNEVIAALNITAVK